MSSGIFITVEAGGRVQASVVADTENEPDSAWLADAV
jgi:hypothetical protein